MTRKTTACRALLMIALIAAISCRRQSAPPEGPDVRTEIATLYAEYAKAFPDVPAIDAGELLALRATNDVVLVDVRTKEERDVSMIPGAISAENFERGGPPADDKIVVAYCTIGARSGAYAKNLRRSQIPALNLKEGVLGWAHAGQLFVDGTNETRAVHVYGRNWDLLPEAYRGEW